LRYLEQKTASIQSAEFQYSPTKKGEAEQVAKSLCDAGKTADAHYYANEGNGFTKRENQIDAIRRTIDLFDRYLNDSR
jgi:dipeptidyl aminopeptidase/acylaminoacyl peptidase